MSTDFPAFRLPPGRHGLTRAQVAENQSWRLIGAVTELLAEEGYLSLRAHAVAKRAGVSSLTLYRRFQDLDHCILAACETAVRRVEAAVAASCSQAGSLPSSQGVVQAVVALVAADPSMVHLLSPEVRAAVPQVARPRNGLSRSLAARLRYPTSSKGSLAGVRACLLVEAALSLVSSLPAPALQPSSSIAGELSLLFTLLR